MEGLRSGPGSLYAAQDLGASYLIPYVVSQMENNSRPYAGQSET